MFIIFQVYLSLSSDEENSVLEQYFQFAVAFCVEENLQPKQTSNKKQETSNKFYELDTWSNMDKIRKPR